MAKLQAEAGGVLPKTLDQGAQDAAELPASDRLKLARLMLDLTDMEPASPDQVQGEWDEEIQRRLADLRSGQVTGLPLEVTPPTGS